MVCPSESIEGDAVTLDRLQPVRQLSIDSARTLYREVGFLIDGFEKPCVLADALVPDCPVIGVSDTFANLSSSTSYRNTWHCQDQHAFIEQIRVILQQGLSENAASLLTKENFLSPRPRNLGGPAFSPPARTMATKIMFENQTWMFFRHPEVVISENPIRRTRQGLFFALRMEGVLRDGWYSSWPMLGLTTISPDEMQRHGYPLRAEWCGKSVCIGGEFQAAGNCGCQMGELQKFEGPQPRWRNRPTTPWDLGEGDIMGMLYTPNGDIHLMLSLGRWRRNYETVLTVSTGKPLEQRDYYALVDCRGQAYELMLLPYDSWHQPWTKAPPNHRLVVDHVTRSAASLAVANCSFSVSIADPSQPDMLHGWPLVAVSPAFEAMTGRAGYPCEEIVGLNCRFLNHDCEMSVSQRVKLRRACQTGKPFTGLLQLDSHHSRLRRRQNRRKTGELFVNLLDMRGLRVAKDAETGEDIWYLVGIQSDVTDLNQDAQTSEIQKRHGRELKGWQVLRSTEGIGLMPVFADVAVTSRHSMVEEATTVKGTGDAVIVPAVQEAPTYILFSSGFGHCLLKLRPDWLKYDSVDDDSEPEQVDARAKHVPPTVCVPKVQNRSIALSTTGRKWNYMPMVAAFVFGLASTVLGQLVVKRFRDSHLENKAPAPPAVG
eukprot:Skav203339  [mRNA]  locus=scaffold284:625594:657961:- [translate_table: standard]